MSGPWIFHGIRKQEYHLQIPYFLLNQIANCIGKALCGRCPDHIISIDLPGSGKVFFVSGTYSQNADALPAEMADFSGGIRNAAGSAVIIEERNGAFFYKQPVVVVGMTVG